MILTITAHADGNPVPPVVRAPQSVMNGDFTIVPSENWAPNQPEAQQIGDGGDETTLWTFDFRFQPQYLGFLMSPEPLSSASLTLWLKAANGAVATDYVRIQGLADIGGYDGAPIKTDVFYGLPIGGDPAPVMLQILGPSAYGSTDILSVFNGIGGNPSGRIPMLYADDAVVVRAELQLSKIVPEPPSGAAEIPWLPIFNPRWYWETHGGLTPGPVPIDPAGPYRRELAAVLALVNSAHQVSPKLRAKTLELALEELSIVASALKKEIRDEKKKQV